MNEKDREKLREEFRRKIEEEEKLATKIVREEGLEKTRRRKGFIKRLEFERREALLNGIVLKAQEVATLQRNQLEQEEKLAAELDIIRRQEIVDEKLRLHLRENSHELKELESQLKVAYSKKAIAAQLAEKEANKYEEQVRERRAREVLEKAMGTLEEQEIAMRLNEKKEKEQFRHSLQDQIIEKERLRQQEFVAFMKERKMFDEIVQKIKDEEVKEMERKQLMQQKLKEEMEQFYAAREVWKAKERLVIQEENEKIKQINEEKAKQVQESLGKKQKAKEAYEKIYKKISDEMNEKQKQMSEREELVSNLIWNEKQEEEKRKAEEQAAKEMARKSEARAAFKEILAEKTRKKKEERDLELEFAKQMNLKIQEEERKEKEKEEKRRQILIENRKYNEQAIRENVLKKAEGLKLTQLINELREKEEEDKARLIEEERLRMLREHAPKLLGYFPKSCLRESDLEKLGLASNSPLPESCPLSSEK